VFNSSIFLFFITFRQWHSACTLSTGGSLFVSHMVRRKERTTMKRFLVAALSLGLMSVTFPDAGWAQAPAAKCPPELAQAQAALQKAQQARAKRAQASAKSQEVQAPRGQEVQAPRGQEVQAPRGQEVQAPRGQEVQAPRGQEVQAPRAQEIQAPKVAKARTLVQQAHQACTKGDMTLSTEKAKEALELLK
jgi:hypothetical protein